MIVGTSQIKVLQPFDYINILLQESGKILAEVDFQLDLTDGQGRSLFKVLPL